MSRALRQSSTLPGVHVRKRFFVAYDIVKKCKLKWYGYVTRSTGLAKTILQGTVQRGRRGRQKKIWEDNIPEWTGMTLGAAMRKPERREEWRELVARSSVAPQWSTKTTG